MKIKIIKTVKDTNYKLSVVREEEIGIDIDIKNSKFIEINENIEFQEIEGFGGAFTESSAYNFLNMSKEKREEIVKAYFSEEGNKYNLCRTHMNSCDFALGNYSCCEKEGDYELKTFNIERDKKYIIPLIKEALKYQPDMKIFFSPWSPPAWMKTNGEMNNGGMLKEECRDAWAKHYVKFIEAYEMENIKFWGLSVQNEPMAVQVWDSCIYTHEEERDFVRDHLGPTLHKAGRQDVKVIVWDHNRDLAYDRAKTILEDKECNKYVWGTGFHWYSGDQFENLLKINEEFPDKKLIFTEGCQEGGAKPGSWAVGERYGHHIIGDLNSFTVAWVDWNIILDTKGGPNHVGNLCDAPILLDTEKDEIIYQSSYYYLGHFSRYIKEGAKRIEWIKNKENDLQVTSFKNPNGEIVVIVMNSKDEENNFALKYKDTSTNLNIEPHSIATIILS